MKIGILSDTHDQFTTAVAAVRLLQQQGVSHLVHCGDLCDERALDALAGVPASFVFGNNDYDRDTLRKYAQLLGIECLGGYGVITLEGKRIAVTHGDDQRLISRLTRPGQPIDYLLTGHTHARHDQRVGALRWINPGALFRAKVKSVATLDLKTDIVSFFTVFDADD